MEGLDGSVVDLLKTLQQYSSVAVQQSSRVAEESHTESLVPYVAHPENALS
jgi:hypothetical protein